MSDRIEAIEHVIVSAASRAASSYVMDGSYDAGFRTDAEKIAALFAIEAAPDVRELVGRARAVKTGLINLPKTAAMLDALCDALTTLSAKCAEQAAEIERLKGDVEFTHQWYAERLERLRKLADDNGLTREHCAIVANGSLSGSSVSYEPPTYAQILNTAKHRAEQADADNARLRQRVEELEAMVYAPTHHADGSVTHTETWKGFAEAVVKDADSLRQREAVLVAALHRAGSNFKSLIGEASYDRNLGHVRGFVSEIDATLSSIRNDHAHH